MKKLFGLALIGAGALTLSACGGGNSWGEVNVLADLTDEEVLNLDTEITLWHAMTQGGAHEAALNEIITEFNKTYPNITINHQSQGYYSDLMSNTVTSITAKNNPTMVVAYTDHTATYVDSGIVLPLDEYIARDSFGLTQTQLDDFIPAYLAEGTVYDEDGTYYALPFNKSTEVLYVNETIRAASGVTFSTPPTWAEVEQVSAYANTQNKVGLIYDSAPNAFITLAEQYGGAYTSVTEPHYLFNNATTETAVTYFTDKAETSGTFTSNATNSVAHPLYATTGYWSGGYASGYFSSGETESAESAAMVIGSSAGANYYSLDSGEIGIYQIPQYDENNTAAIQQGTNLNILAANTTDEERLAAWLFTAYVTAGEGNAEFAAASGYLPVTNAAYNSTVYQNFIATDTAMARAAATGYAQRNAYFVSPAFVGSAKARIEVGQVMNDIIYEGKSFQAAAQAAIDELNA